MLTDRQDSIDIMMRKWAPRKCRLFSLSLLIVLAWPTTALGVGDSSGLAFDQNPEAVSSRLEQIRSSHQIPGLWVAASSGGRIVYAQALGAKWVNGASATVDDSLPIGSISKYITADLTCILISQGKLKSQATVQSIFPQLTSEPCFSATIVDLLSHRSGFPRDHIPWLEDPNSAESRAQWRQSQLLTFAGLEEMDRRGYRAKERAQSPNTAETYSNFAYSVLGTIAEKVVGKPMESVFAEYMFKPFGMGSARFGIPNPSGKDTDQPLGHFTQNAEGAWLPFVNWHDQTEPRSMAATSAGGIQMTVQDLCRYLTWRCYGPSAKNAPYNSQIMATLWRQDQQVDSASGATSGYWAWFRIDRNRKVVVVYIANANLTEVQRNALESYLSGL